jgi:cytoskeletal protein CcmA (bactofilin family)
MDTTRSVGRAFALVLAVLVVVSAFSGVVAAETRSGGAIVIGPDEVITGGLDAFGGSVLIQGTVQGDVNAFAGDIRVAEGAVVNGDLNAFGGSVILAGTVEGDLNGAAGTVTLEEAGIIEGDAAVGGGTVVVAGTVSGAVEVGAETLVLRESARITGDVRHDAGTFQNDGAAVDGRIVRDDRITGPQPVAVDPQVEAVFNVLFGIYAFLVNLVVGAILLLALPGFSSRVTGRAISDPVRSGGYGLLTLFGVPFLLVLFALTIVGIPITLVGAMVFGVSAWLAAIYGRIAVGEWLVGYAGVDNRWLALVVGLLVVAVAVRIPFVGWLVDLAVLVLGLGALAVTVYRTYRGESGEPETEYPESTETDEGAHPA